MAEIVHGTRSGYQQHHLQKVPPCDPCMQANRAYKRAWREANPQIMADAAVVNRARNYAIWILAREHHARFQEIVAEELLKLRRAAAADQVGGGDRG